MVDRERARAALLDEETRTSPGHWDARTLTWIGVATGIGVLAGVLAKIADASGGWELGVLTSNMAVWTLGVSLWGAFAPRWYDAVGRSVAFALAMNLGYYAWAQVVLGFPETPITRMWLALSLTAVPAVALLVHWAVRASHWWAGASLALVGAITLTDHSVMIAWYAVIDGVSGPQQAPLAAAVSVLTWAVILFVLPRYRETRLWALVFAVPACLVAAHFNQEAWGWLTGL